MTVNNHIRIINASAVSCNCIKFRLDLFPHMPDWPPNPAVNLKTNSDCMIDHTGNAG